VLIDHAHGAQQMLVLGWTLGGPEVQGECHSLKPAQHAVLPPGSHSQLQTMARRHPSTSTSNRE